MGFNFPDAPTIGQLHPTPAVVGIPQYQWNGSEWVTPEYNPLNYVLKSGDTMLGALNVVTPPTAAAHAASKAYVDLRSVRRNRVVNGAFLISQENGVTPGAVSGYYAADQWVTVVAGTITGLQTGMMVIPPYNQIFIQGSKAAFAANEYAFFQHNIEGYEVADFLWGTASARQVVLRFDVNCSSTGTFAVSIRNNALNRSFIAPFTVSTANVWTTIVIPIQGDTTGVWETTNITGLVLGIAAASGTSQQGVAGWQAGNKLATAAITNPFAAGATFYIRNVGLYLDTDNLGTAPEWVVPSYTTELEMCRRYYQQAAPSGLGCVGLTSFVYVPIPVSPVLRALPLVTHPFTDAAFTASGSIGATQWGLQNVQIFAAAKTAGTFTFGYNYSSPPPTPEIAIYMYGMTLSGQTTVIVAGASLAPVKINSRM